MTFFGWFYPRQIELKIEMFCFRKKGCQGRDTKLERFWPKIITHYSRANLSKSANLTFKVNFLSMSKTSKNIWLNSINLGAQLIWIFFDNSALLLVTLSTFLAKNQSIFLSLHWIFVDPNCPITHSTLKKW